MNHLASKILFLFFFLWYAGSALASDTLKITKLFQPKEKDGLLILPLLYSTPDTRLAYGAVGFYYFRIGDDEDKNRLSYVKLLTDYTQNRQLDIWSSWNIFLKDEAWLLRGEARYRNFPDRFYGIGNQSPAGNPELYSYDILNARLTAMRQFWDKIYAGIDYQIANLHNFRVEAAGILRSQNITGSSGGVNGGAGLIFLIDSRDNVVNASRGTFLDVGIYAYGKALAGDFSYRNLTVNFSRYHRIGKKDVIAYQILANFNFGNPPFLMLAAAGNDDILRGYARNRFRDLNFAGTQVEYRRHLFWRIGAVAFAGIGDVFKTPSDVNLQTLKYSYGGGLRLALNRKEQLNLRLDYGFGRHNQGLYFSIAEAF
ncbi:BamA/TamA family outer membrane protein [Rhodoflexus caldus]|uniref:BamA/TamA family outer membrane protein n=1 Tax=Rhodoflexus caldus TaxID=2891236 RepID=UPI002029EA7B|nr:BamA/TamA family outer membrane protein [Rhodoflexus caldus]